MTQLPAWLSILPALVAIAYVMWRRDVVIALVLAIFASEWLLLMDGGHYAPTTGLLNTIERVVSVFADQGNTRLLLFCVLVGALLAYMRFSGGVRATVNRLVKSGIATTPRRTGLVTFGTGVVIFIESNLSVLTAGILSRGLFDKFNMSRERLAYIIDSTSAPICILILLNAWGAFVLGLIASYFDQQDAVSILVSTIPLNVYAWSTLLLVLYTVISGKVYGPMARTEASNAPVTEVEFEHQAGRTRDMLIPLAVLVVSMLGFMVWTGGGDIMAGSGSKSVLYATALATTVGYLMLVTQARFTGRQVLDEGFKGMGELLPLVTILLLSIALGASVKELGTGVFIAGLVADYLPLFTVPAIVFIAGAFASFTTGTSWGTFALLVPIAMPIALNLGLPPSLMLAAVLGGGVFGDHCSPVSDTTAVSSLAAGCDILDHVRTQLPYALVCGVITVVAYLVMGYMVV